MTGQDQLEFGGIIYRDEHGRLVPFRTLTKYDDILSLLKQRGCEIRYANPNLSEEHDAIFTGMNVLFAENRLNDGMLEIALNELNEQGKQK